jgi:calcium-dependent protein kinase
MMFIVSQLMTSQEKEQLREIFMSLDLNGDGELTAEELLQGYTTLYKSEEQARAEVRDLMEEADADKNGSINYTGILQTHLQSSCLRPPTKRSWSRN